ncbi:hypothetical protein GCM10010400_70410 [Streptomyces aculeolatus]|uniref:SMI1/KNR4 family protein n=1 Tax=Streptomyces aculeolatus TaxID=270689 RepID=UPI001CED592C|nr:SMI1/KNR4 family protein [Streptomyces aculeolatus]
MTLENLERVLPDMLEIREPRPRDIDWAAVAREFGTDFPEDYKELAAFYGSIEIDEYVGIASPDPGEEACFARGRRSALYPVECLYEAGMSHGYVPYPQPFGLVPWGGSIDGDEFHWRTNPAGPDAWTIVVAGRNGDWVEFSGTLTEYLAGLISGEVAPDGLPPDFPGRSPSVAVWE